MIVHWDQEKPPWKGAKVTDDKSKVTCPDCLRMIAFMEDVRSESGDDMADPRT